LSSPSGLLSATPYTPHLKGPKPVDHLDQRPGTDLDVVGPRDRICVRRARDEVADLPSANEGLVTSGIGRPPANRTEQARLTEDAPASGTRRGGWLRDRASYKEAAEGSKMRHRTEAVPGVIICVDRHFFKLVVGCLRSSAASARLSRSSDGACLPDTNRSGSPKRWRRATATASMARIAGSRSSQHAQVRPLRRIGQRPSPGDIPVHSYDPR
jgi:hypothetical protein